VRAVGVHADVIVVVSRIWQTACTAIRAGEEALVIDSLVLPDELEMMPAVLEQARFPARGLIATHGDWDHVLGRLAFPGMPLGVAETTAARLRAEPGDAQRRLRSFDEEHYVERPAPLSLGTVEALPVPGHLGVGDREVELHPADGHTADGMAVWAPWAAVLVAGDYLSPVEIPMISVGGSAELYAATLERLAPLITQAEAVIPGHGGPLSAQDGQRILAEDRAYLDALRADGAAAPLPAGRRTAAQKRIHAENVARAAAGG
jgi:glyoxylase-like metal-dependent hydrolase (beta-lactamase superfamily II)